MPESGSYGSVRGAAGNSRPYRECRPSRRLPSALGPVSESLQGRNPREVGTDGAASAMGILASLVACTMQAEIAERSNAPS